MGVAWITPVEVTPGTASAWTDVDVSAYIPSGATGVLVEFVSNTAGTAVNTNIRNDGSTDNRLKKTYGGGHIYAACGCNSSTRVFEVYISSVTTVDVFLLGYFDDGAVFNTNGVDKTITTADAWTDIDIGVDDGAIAAVFEQSYLATSYAYGLRNNGSTDDRYGTGYQREYPIVGVTNDICEGYITDVDSQAFYLLGYINSNAYFYTNASTAYTPTTTGSYTDLPELPANATGAFFEVTAPSRLAYGLRANGTSYDQYWITSYLHGWAYVACDVNRVIECKIASADLDLFLVGYSTSGVVTLSGVQDGTHIDLSWA
ncbi:MAG: hypothetical protein PHR07_04515 [Acidaminococcaceae bacterium]|nr:hypothetical protein [Acidaminococcaceae bacterium]